MKTVSSQTSSPETRILGLIPARWESSRFPGKPLHSLLGKPLLQHVVERARLCQEIDHLAVATDDDRIESLCSQIGVDCLQTRRDHPSGTDRIAEAAAQITGEKPSHVFNIQGDEPLLDPQLLDSLIRVMKEEPELPMITAASPITEDAQQDDPNIVKVVLNSLGNALYFSRSCIPYRRTAVPSLPSYRHIGLYGYHADFLTHFVTLSPSPLEQAEGLEQLRALESGACIRVVITDHEAIGLDSPDQIPHIERLLAEDRASL